MAAEALARHVDTPRLLALLSEVEPDDAHDSCPEEANVDSYVTEVHAMALEPVQARCRGCGRELVLAELVKVGSGACPSCGGLLAPGYTHLLLEEARKADALQHALVMCLQRLVGLPGNLELDPESVFRNAVARVGWEERLAADRTVMQTEAAALRPQVREWRRLPRRDRQREAAALFAGLHRLAQRLRLHSRLLDQRDADLRNGGETPLGVGSGPLLEAAQGLESAAQTIADDNMRADDHARAALSRVEAAVSKLEDRREQEAHRLRRPVSASEGMEVMQ